MGYGKLMDKRFSKVIAQLNKILGQNKQDIQEKYGILALIILLCINPHLPSGPVHPYQLEESISNFMGVWCTFSFVFDFVSKRCRPWSDAVFCGVVWPGSDCLPMSQKWDAMLMRVNLIKLSYHCSTPMMKKEVWNCTKMPLSHV